MQWVAPTIKVTAEISLEKITDQDCDDLYEVYSDHDVLKFTDEEALKDRSYMKQFMKSVTNGYSSSAYCELKINENNKAIGPCSFHSIDEKKRECEIGFLLNRK